MRRNKEQLRWISQRLEQYINDKWPGLGAMVVIFDTAGPAERPINIMLHGVDEGNAVRLFHEAGDLVKKATGGEDSLIHKPGPLIIPPRMN